MKVDFFPITVGGVVAGVDGLMPDRDGRRLGISFGLVGRFLVLYYS